MMTAPKFPTIEIDAAKCTTPFDCKLCIQACPQAVFFTHAVKVERGRETDPKDPGAYILFPAYRDKCTGCMDCVDLCPVDALKITFP